MRPREPCTAAKYVRTKLRQRDSALSALFMKRAWQKLRYRLEHIGLLIAARLVPLWARPVPVALATMFRPLASLLDRYGRSIGLANLDCAFGPKSSAAAQHRNIR